MDECLFYAHELSDLVTLNTVDLHLVLNYLSKKGMAFTTTTDPLIIKFKTKTNQPITQSDIGLLSCKKCISKLTLQIETLQSGLLSYLSVLFSSAQLEAKQSLGIKPRALFYLSYL